MSAQSHSFDILLASRYGVEESILLHHFQHWIRINTRAKRNKKKFEMVSTGQITERYFTYQSRKEIQLHFPYWNYDHIKYLCEKLVKNGILIAINFNKSPIDKTLWYAFVNPEEFNLSEEQVDKYYENSKNVYEGHFCPSKGTFAQPIPDTITTYTIKKSKESSLKRAKEKSASPPPPPPGPYQGKFEDKIEISQEQHERLIKKFGSEKVEAYVEQLYRWSLTNPKDFKKKKRHDMVVETWIERDLKKEKPQSFDKDLNEIQKENWRLNQEIVNELKAERPDRASGLNWFYKTRILKDKNNNSFDLFGLMNHKDFCMQLERHLKIKILHVRFPHE